MSTAETVPRHEDWLALVDRAWRNPDAVGSLACPGCGQRAICYVYLVSDPDDSQGMFALWCQECLVGFPPGFGRVPEGAVVMDMARRAEIPNYRTAIPE